MGWEKRSTPTELGTPGTGPLRSNWLKRPWNLQQAGGDAWWKIPPCERAPERAH